MNLLTYLLKMILASAVLYGYYRFFLRNKRFHHYNRFFLLGALLLSIALPFIRIELLYEPQNPVNDALYRTVSVINADYHDVQVADTWSAPVNEPVFTLVNSIYLVYAVGALFLLTLVVKSLLYIRSLGKRYPAERITSLRFYNTREPGTPFSFFRSIFWNEQLPFNSHEGQQIFRHELFHVQHRHSTDRLLAEVVTAIFWFNPFFHLIKKELKAIHEFLADQFAISGSDRYAYATLLVQQALESGKHRVTNHFFQNHIKRRIAMITEFQQSKYGYWSRVMILPVSLLLFCFITVYAKKPAKDTVSLKDSPAMQIGQIVPVNNKVLIADTVPGKAAREREMKKRMEEVELVKKRMAEQEERVRKLREVEMEELRKKMQEHEVIAMELEQNRQRQLDEIRMLQKEVQERKSQLSKEKAGQVEEIRKLMKELEQDKNDKPEVKKMKEARLVELKNEFDRIQDKMHDKQEAREDILREKLRELEKQSQNQHSEQRARQADLQNLRDKMIRQQKELMIEEKKQMQLYREQLKSMEQELRKEEKEQRKPKDESGFKMDPRKQGLVDGVTKKVYKVEQFTVHNAVATVEHSAESTHEYEWEPFQTVYVNQDTVPARKARIGSPGKPAKVFSKPKAALAPNKEPRPGAEDRSKLNRQKREESNDRRVEERRQLNKRVDEKRQLAKRSDRKNLFAEKPGKRPLFEKKPSRIKVAPKSPAKPVQKLKPVPRSEKSPGGSEGEQENEETADKSVNGDK